MLTSVATKIALKKLFANGSCDFLQDSYREKFKAELCGSLASGWECRAQWVANNKSVSKTHTDSENNFDQYVTVKLKPYGRGVTHFDIVPGACQCKEADWESKRSSLSFARFLWLVVWLSDTTGRAGKAKPSQPSPLCFPTLTRDEKQTQHLESKSTSIGNCVCRHALRTYSWTNHTTWAQSPFRIVSPHPRPGLRIFFQIYGKEHTFSVPRNECVW